MTAIDLLPYFIEMGIGVIILALVRYIFKREVGLLMSKEEHAEKCKNATKEMREGLKEEFTDLKDYFNLQIENKVMKSLNNLNGNLEQKIADIVSSQVEKLGKELTTKIDGKLDVVEILKVLVPKKLE